MDIQKALATVAKLHEEKNKFHAKKLSAKKRAIICLIVGVVFLACFITFICITVNDHSFTSGVALIIIFGVLTLIFLEAAIVFFVLMKCVYAYQEENRIKILKIIDQEVNKNKRTSNE